MKHRIRIIGAWVLTALLALFSTARADGRLSPQGGVVVGVDAPAGGGTVVTGTAARPAVGLITSCTATQVLVWSGSAWTCGSGSTLSGSGTANRLTKWTSGTALGNSVWTDDGSTTTYNTTALTLTTAGLLTTNREVLNGASSGNTLNITASNGWWGIRSDTTDSAAIVGRRTLTANATDDTAAVLGQNSGTMDTTASDIYNYGVRGQSTVSKSGGAHDLYDFGVMGRSGTFNVDSTSTDSIGVGAFAYGGTRNTFGLWSSTKTGVGNSYGLYTHADNTGSGWTIGAFGYANSGPVEFGVIGTAENPGGTATNAIGVYATLGDESTLTAPGGNWALYTNGVSKFSDDATFESGTCVINSAGITCGGTLMTPTATISGVTAGNGLTGGGTTGTVTLDVACSTGLTCNANDIAITARDFGDITTTSAGSVWTIDNDVVTYAKMQNVSATSRFLGRITAGAGDPEELTGTQATSLLDQASTVAATKGVVPGSNGATTAFLRGDMTWQTISAGITNSASANYYAKSDGTNLVNGVTKDDGTNWTINTTAGGSTAKVTIVEASGNATFAGTMDVTGNFNVNTNKFSVVAASGNTTIAGTGSVTGDFAVNTNKFTVTASSGNTAVAGTLNVTSDITANAGLTVAATSKGKFFQGGGNAPTASTCGTSPTVAAGARNTTGKVTYGTGSPSACTITFDGTFPATPNCFVLANDGSSKWTTELPSSSSTTQITFSTLITDIGATSATWICMAGG